MKKNLIRTVSVVFLSLGALLPGNTVGSPSKNPIQKVLVIHSYHPAYEWVSTISRGIKRVFEREKDIQVETYYMDTKTKTSEQWKVESGRKARELITLWDPDVVITVDDNAQEYAGKYYTGKERPKIVFCGVNNKAGKYGYPASNITGILERPHIKQTFCFLDSVVPGIEQVAVISDNSPTSKGAMEYIKEQIQILNKKAVAYEMPETFDQWKSSVTLNQRRSDAILIYMYHTIKKNGQEISTQPQEVMKWTIANSSIPVVGFFTFTIDDGALLGVVESGLEHGKEAAITAMGLLKGKNIRQFPIKTAEKGIVMFNKSTAEKLNIPVSDGLKNRIDIMVGG